MSLCTNFRLCFITDYTMIYFLGPISIIVFRVEWWVVFHSRHLKMYNILLIEHHIA